MATAAVFPFFYLLMRNRVSSDVHDKDLRVTVITSQPLGVRIMGIDHVGKPPLDLEVNVQINDRVSAHKGIQGIPRFNKPLFQRCDPIHISSIVPWKILQRDLGVVRTLGLNNGGRYTKEETYGEKKNCGFRYQSHGASSVSGEVASTTTAPIISLWIKHDAFVKNQFKPKRFLL